MGGEIDDPDMIELVEDSGAYVAADRFCYGSIPGRQEIVLNDTEDVLTQIVRINIEQTSCPRYVTPNKIKYRQDQAAKLVEEYHADGIIYEQMKFCSYWSFERTLQSHVLSEEYRIPTLSIDRPYQAKSSGQLRTRVQAFVESLEIKKIKARREEAGKMKQRTKIQKLKKALPGIVKDVKHYAKPRVKLHNKGLGDYYTEGYRSLNQREWKGVKDTAYDFASWLKVYGYMAVALGKHPVALTKSFVRYPWMASYLTVANMLDRHKLGLRGKQLRYTQEQFYGVVHNSVDVIAKIIERDENLNYQTIKRAAKLRAKTVMFDEMTPSIIMAGFPMLDWIDIAMSPVCLPGEVDQNANIMYVDAAERMGLAADVCPLPSAEVGCAIVDDYPQVGSSFYYKFHAV